MYQSSVLVQKMIDPPGTVDIGTRIRLAREDLGLSQSALAEIAGVSKQTQMKYEAGKTMPDAAYLALMGRLGADVLFLVTGQRTPEIRQVGNERIVISAEEAALVNCYRNGSPILQGYLQEVVRLPDAHGNTVAIGGDVGQSIAGDQSVTAPVTFNVGRGRK